MQGKHIQGHKNFIENKSYLSINSVEEGQLFDDYLVHRYNGTGIIERDRNGNWKHQETITAKERVGFVKNLEGKWVTTNKATIHYSKKRNTYSTNIKKIEGEKYDRKRAFKLFV